MSKFKIGDNVKIIRDLYSDGTNYGGEVGKTGVIVNFKMGNNYPEISGGDFPGGYNVHIDRLELINEGDTKVSERRTFKLLKDTPETNKGTLYQEKLDGLYGIINQPYTTIEHYDIWADSVDQSEWFTEVFHVDEYMTREELDQFEAFKKTLKPTKSKYTKRTTKKGNK